MATRMQQRRGTAAQWTSANPVLAAGEIGFETDTNKFKMGNGSSVWSALQYFANAAELAAIIDGAPELLNTLNELAASIGDDADFIGTVTAHTSDTTDVHGIPDTSLLVTQTDLANAIGSAEVDQASLAGTGIDWNSVDNRFDIDSTIATVTALNAAVELATASGSALILDVAESLADHSTATTDVHGIGDTSLLATKGYADQVGSDANTAADVKVSVHSSDTTDVHGIADTSLLATTANVATAKSEAVSDAGAAADSKIATHSNDTTAVHGIADTSLLATTANVATAKSEAILAAASTTDTKISDHNLDTTDVHGIADTAALATKTYSDSAVSTHNSNTSTAHGVTGAVVGTTNTQTLTNKSVDLASNTVTGTKSQFNAALSDGDFATLAGSETLTNKTITSPLGIVKADVGLGNVDNTSDANKPVSTATQTALDLKAPKAAPTFTGTLTAADVTISGNLTVSGTTTTVNTTNFTTSDPVIYLADGNNANLVDVGFVGSYNDGTYAHQGLVKDSSDGKWKLFKGVTDEPTTTVNFAQGSLDALKVGAFEATTMTPSSGVVFTDGTQTKEGVISRTPIVQKTAAYTLSALTERDSLIEVSSASAVNITIPLNSAVAFPVGTSIDILQTGAGQVSINGTAGVTINSAPSGGTNIAKLRTTWSSCTLFKRATDTWVVFGDLTA